MRGGCDIHGEDLTCPEGKKKRKENENKAKSWEKREGEKEGGWEVVSFDGKERSFKLSPVDFSAEKNPPTHKKESS